MRRRKVRASFWCSNIGGFDSFVDICLRFQQVIEARFTWLRACPTDVFHDVAEDEVEVLINDALRVELVNGLSNLLLYETFVVFHLLADTILDSTVEYVLYHAQALSCTVLSGLVLGWLVRHV